MPGTAAGTAYRLFWMLLSAIAVCVGPPAFGQEQGANPGGTSSLYANIQKWVEESAASESDSFKTLEERLKQLRGLRDDWQSEIKAYNIKATTYASLLLLPKSESKNLDKTWNELRDALAALKDELTQTENESNDIERQLAETEKQIKLRRDQLTDLEAVSRKDPEVAPLIGKLKALLARLADKKDLLQSIQQIYAGRLGDLKAAGSKFQDLSGQFEQYLRQKQQERIFAREKRPPVAEALAQLATEFKSLATDAANTLSPDYWQSEFRELWDASGLLTLSLAIVLGALAWGLGRLRSLLKKWSASSFCSRFPAHHLFCVLVGKSLPLAGFTAFVWACTQIDTLYFSTPSLHLLLNVLLAWLVTKWGRDAVKYWERVAGQPLPANVSRRMRTLLTAIRCFAVVYALLAWTLRPPSALLSLTRFVFELFFIGLTVFFRRACKTAASGEACDRGSRLRAFLPTALQVVAVAGFVADLAGFGNLTTYWFLTWGLTAAVCLWWYIFYRMLSEWDALYQERKTRDAEGPHVADTVQWLFIRLGQLVWGASLIALMLLVWGGRQNAFAVVVEAMSRSIHVGNMQFSLLGVLYAGLALLATHALASFWRHIFQTKFLNRSGLETGLQESITTISVYVVWALGILVALHVFGLNTASLAVAFGALGIGLGFGLQNIFNNFISGIILLFERPIQVGDDVEINGVWATVKKINVRATVVQTYDNASLIIPNSEFISNQVTNWSFKDKRLRRKISVGVAYGSDIELVRQTLLEIAAGGRHVLKFPRPDVLFQDFGDSALIFVLRVWTDIDHMLEVETEVRFAIDRLFRQRGIEIAFPQLDLHIQSLPAKPEGPAAGG